MKRVAWLAVVALMGLVQPCLAQTALDWELDEATFVEVSHVAKQDISIAGKTQNTETTIRFLFKIRPAKVNRMGTVFEFTVLACDDASTSSLKGAEKGIFKGFKDQKFRITVGPGNRTLELGEMKTVAEAVLGDEAKNGSDDEKKFAHDMIATIVRVHLLDTFMPLPDGEVSPGDTWKHTAGLKLQPLAEMSADREFKLVGPQIHDGKKVEAITWTSAVDYKTLTDEKGVLPFKVKAMKITEKPLYEGTVLWNVAEKRPVRVDSIQTYEFDMEMEINGTEVFGKAKGVDTLVTRFFSKNPQEAADNTGDEPGPPPVDVRKTPEEILKELRAPVDSTKDLPTKESDDAKKSDDEPRDETKTSDDN